MLGAWVNLGISGQSALTMASNATSRAIANKQGMLVNYVVIWGGTNDLGGTTAIDTFQRLELAADRWRAQGYRVIVCTITPVPSEDRRAELNSLLRLYWRYFADALADLDGDSRINTYSPTYFSDSIHMNNAGYAVVASIVKGAVGRVPR